MSSSRSSDSCSSGRSNASAKVDETIPLMLNQAHPKTYGSLFMYHFLRNTAGPASKGDCNEKQKMEKQKFSFSGDEPKRGGTKKLFTQTKILVQQPTFDEDPCIENFNQCDADSTLKEGEDAKSTISTIREKSVSLNEVKRRREQNKSDGQAIERADEAERAEGDERERRRTRLTHQRSISLVNESSPAEQTEAEKNGEQGLRPRGMSLPHAHDPRSLEVPQRRRGMSFLQSSRNDVFGGGLASLYSQLQNLTVPTFSFMGQADSGMGNVGGRKISFSLRKLSQTNLYRSDSMISLTYRSLVSYITDDNLDALRSFLETKKFQIDDRDENNSTALIFAATKGKVEFVRELIQNGADINSEDADNWTPLLCAAKEGFLDVCRELLDRGAAVDHRDMGSWTPLLWASYKGHTQIAELLIEKGADVNAHDNYHICPIHWACGRGFKDIVRMLLQKGVKVNVGDKYGTTALVWACRKGNAEIVEMLLKAGANVDTAGMYSWTPLIVAAAGNHAEVVNLLLEHKPNVNALDKDGYTALALACKEGYYDIVLALLSAGAYINIQDRGGDTNLILAVKGGHRNIVEALLKKYADIDTPGKDKKTAIYTAVEKGNVSIVKLLLSANPDLEVTTKDGDTPLLRAVRSRNAEIVQLLLDKKAKVSVTDKKGDTALHIAMRARSKAIVEVLLRNPKNSQLLYRPNRNGETPYNIDINQQKTILGQIFGARRLNTNEDNENMLGYDLYSSALADILSEPSLSMPITVGLYAKWGSGKSFLLNKLKDEMKNFARQWVDPTLKMSSLLIITVFHITLVLATIVALVSTSWLAGLVTLASFFVLMFTFLSIFWCCGKRYDWNWPYQASVYLARRINSYRLVLQVIFCHPPGAQWNDSLVQPIRFNFTDQTRISTTTGGENSVVMMLGSLYDSIENDYGALSTRMYRAFRPKCVKATSPWRWRKACCVPHIVIFEIGFFLFLLEVCFLAVYFEIPSDERETYLSDTTLKILLITIGTLLAVGFVANMYTLSHLMSALIFSQRRHLQRTIARLETLKSEGFLQALKGEVSLMTDMVKCLDSFTKQQTRLVIIVNGLDSCEQDKVLMVLDAIHMLFSDVNSPFIVILAIDPHIISKAVELNSRKLISETNIGGHEYLRNMVHLPFFLANSALRKVKIAQSTANKKSTSTTFEIGEEGLSFTGRRLSGESNFTSSMEKLKVPSKKSSRKLRPSDSVASSIGSNLNRIGGAQDLTKMLLTDDYFSDVNPRSMRRLLNVVYVTGRLLKAFQMDFNWYHLAVWINITEQWPYRTSWLIWFYEMNEDSLDDQLSLKSIYDEVRPKIPVNKEIEPLLERDRDEKKFDIFLSYHRSSLLLSDLKIFLPFTINLDPYIKKVIKEDAQEERWTGSVPYLPMRYQTPRTQKSQWLRENDWATSKGDTRLPRINNFNSSSVSPLQPMLCQACVPATSLPCQAPLSATSSLPVELLDTKLSQRSVEGVCELIHRLQDIDEASAARYISVIKENNINGKVLLHCDMDELKKVLQMNFGDWEMFKVMIISLREHELSYVTQTEEATAKNVRFLISKDRRLTEKKRDVSKAQDSEKETRRNPNKSSSVENQVTLEDQMICGALQTLNEEACEDVLEESGDVGELPDHRNEKVVHADNYESLAELSETNSLIYLKDYEGKERPSEHGSGSKTSQNSSASSLQPPAQPGQPGSRDSSWDSSTGFSKRLQGFDPAALHISYPKKATETYDQKPSTSKVQQPVKRVAYKDNVVHVETQTLPLKKEGAVKNIHKRPSRDKSKSPPSSSDSNSSHSSLPPLPQAPAGEKSSKGTKRSNQNKKKDNQTDAADAMDSINKSDGRSVKRRMFGEEESGGDKSKKDTTVVFLQSSPLSQPYWQATTAEDSSPTSSACGTPVLQRRSHRPNSRQGSVRYREGPRPRTPADKSDSMDEHLRTDKYSPPSSPKNFPGFSGEISRSRSTHLFNFSSLKKKKSSDVSKDIPPNLVITPASSTEKIHKLKEKFTLKPFSNSKESFCNADCASRNLFSLENEENAPLVHEAGPQMRNSDSEHNLYMRAKKQGFCRNEGGSGEMTPTSPQKTPEPVVSSEVFGRQGSKQMLLDPESGAVHFLRQSKSSDNLHLLKSVDLKMNSRAQKQGNNLLLENTNPDTPV